MSRSSKQRTSGMHPPDQRPQLLAIVVGIVAKLLLELPDNRNRVLEGIVGGFEGAGVGGLGGHDGGQSSGGRRAPDTSPRRGARRPPGKHLDVRRPRRSGESRAPEPPRHVLGLLYFRLRPARPPLRNVSLALPPLGTPMLCQLPA